MLQDKKTLFVISLIISIFMWPVIDGLKENQIQPIASAISTVAGILVGFIMASISLFASAKDNTLVKNTTKTGYLPKLVNRLHYTMGLLLAVCFVFLIVLFVPTGISISDFQIISLVINIGVFLALNSFFNFFVSWKRFKEFSEHM